jgi:hypothetical protein
MMATSRARALVLGSAALLAACSEHSDIEIRTGGGSAGSTGTQVTAGTGGSSSTSATTGTTSTVGAGGSSGGAAGSEGSGGTAGTMQPIDGSVGSGGSGGAADGGPSTPDAAGANDAPDSGGWVTIFNGRDLTGWYPLIRGNAYKTDPYRTFRVDAANQLLRVTYEDYPDGSFTQNNVQLFGLLYYDKPLTNYRVHLEYQFQEPQAKNGAGWSNHNSGLMVFCQDPTKVNVSVAFPPLLELQILATPNSAGKPNNLNLCLPGGPTVKFVNGHAPGGPGSCNDSVRGPAPPPTTWVTVEAEVHVNGDTKVYQTTATDMNPAPILTFSGPTWNGQAMTGGYLSLQSEGHPINYRNIRLMELPQ